MSDTVIVALISFAATLITGLGGYRVEQLEKAVEKHNGGMGKICLLEHRVEGLEKDVRSLGI